MKQMVGGQRYHAHSVMHGVANGHQPKKSMHESHTIWNVERNYKMSILIGILIGAVVGWMMNDLIEWLPDAWARLKYRVHSLYNQRERE